MPASGTHQRRRGARPESRAGAADPPEPRAGSNPASPARQPASAGNGGSHVNNTHLRWKLDEAEREKRKVVATLVRLRAARVFNAYVRLWAIVQLARMHSDGTFDGWTASGWGTGDGRTMEEHEMHPLHRHRTSGVMRRWGWLRAVACAGAMVMPWRSRAVVAGALYGRIVDVVYVHGATRGDAWRHVAGNDVAGVLFDAAVLVCVAGHVTGLVATWPRVVDTAGRAVRSQMAWLHLLTGFWRVNTSFLNLRTSCAPVHALQLLDAYWPSPETIHAVAPHLAAVAPRVVIVSHLAAGACMLCGQNRVGRFGAALALLVHLGGALTPSPNNGGVEAAIDGALQLFWFAPEAVTVAFNSLVGTFGPVAAAFASLLAASTSKTWCGTDDARCATWRIAGTTTPIDLQMVLFGVLFATLARTAMTGGRLHAAESTLAPTTRVRSRFANAVALASGAAMFVVGYLGVVMGVLDSAAPTAVASNIRMQGGSNHLLAGHHALGLTALTQSREANAPPHGHALAGGWVRVEACNSTWINAAHPRETTAWLTGRTRAMLRTVGHSGRQWGGATSAIEPPAGDSASRGGGRVEFQRYTVHAAELRRLLHAAGARGEKFHVTFTRLPIAASHPAWAAPPGADGRTATITPAPGGGYECVEWTEGDGEGGHGDNKGATGSGAPRHRPCGAEAASMLTPPQRLWASRLRAVRSYPVVTGARGDDETVAEVHCVR